MFLKNSQLRAKPLTATPVLFFYSKLSGLVKRFRFVKG